MPRLRIRSAGIVFGLAGAACAALQPSPSPSPPSPPATASPSPSARPPWVQELTFGGDVEGAMSQIATDPATRSECTGRNSRSGGAWASTLFGPVGAEVYGVVVTVSGYRGPGAYTAPQTIVQVHRPPERKAVWQTGGTDTASFTVEAGEESGTLEAAATNLGNGRTKLYIRGRWSCRS